MSQTEETDYRWELTEVCALVIVLLYGVRSLCLQLLFLSFVALSQVCVSIAHHFDRIVFGSDFGIFYLFGLEELFSILLESLINAVHTLAEHKELYVLGLDQLLSHLQAVKS